jgi:hypothetical protein
MRDPRDTHTLGGLSVERGGQKTRVSRFPNPPFLSSDPTQRFISAILMSCVVIWPRPILSVNSMVQDAVPDRLWDLYA